MQDLMFVIGLLMSMTSIAMILLLFRTVMRGIARRERDELEQLALRGDHYG